MGRYCPLRASLHTEHTVLVAKWLMASVVTKALVVETEAKTETPMFETEPEAEAVASETETEAEAVYLETETEAQGSWLILLAVTYNQCRTVALKKKPIGFLNIKILKDLKSPKFRFFSFFGEILCRSYLNCDL